MTSIKNYIMQVQNEHLEKIFDTIASYDTCGANDEVLKYMDIEDFKLAVSQILALVKPEPLAKNKDCESKCDKGGTFPCSPNIKFGWMHCTECDKTG